MVYKETAQLKRIENLKMSSFFLLNKALRVKYLCDLYKFNHPNLFSESSYGILIFLIKSNKFCKKNDSATGRTSRKSFR